MTRFVQKTQLTVPSGSDRVITVLSLNVYHGVNAEIFAVPAATDFPDLLQKVAAVYQGYFARNFPERAAALAAEVEASQPDLIGLQEAVLVRTQSPPDGPATPATAVTLDYVQILLDALAARGLHYQVVVQSIGFDAELPSALGFDVRHTDREVILARADLKIADIMLSNAQAGSFTTNCTLPGATLGPIVLQRGWVSVDVRHRGKIFRFISTHLDGDCLPYTSAIQEAQAAELLAGPANTDLPLVLVGDLNSPADGTGSTYNHLIAEGFIDGWVQAGLGEGQTCCQAYDLLNSISTLDRRINFVLFRGGFKVLDVDVLGDNLTDRTPAGLWPSDHAAVVAHFVYTSILGAAPDHPIDFWRTKYNIEEYLKASGLSYTILRPSAFMEWHAHIFNGKSILENGKTSLLGQGTKPRNFVAVRDVAQSATLALTDPKLQNRTLEVGGPENFTNNQAAELYGKLAGVKPRYATCRHLLRKG